MKANFALILALLVPLLVANRCKNLEIGQDSRNVAITGATIIDGNGAQPIPDATIVVDGDRILAIGPSHEIEIPQNTEIVEANGRWIVPGMIDLHIHFWESGRPGAQPTFIADVTSVFPYEDEVAWMKARIPYTLSRYICAGVTSVVALGAIDWEYEVRNLANEMDTAPQVLLAGGFTANYPTEVNSPFWEGKQPGYLLPSFISCA